MREGILELVSVSLRQDSSVFTVVLSVLIRFHWGFASRPVM